MARPAAPPRLDLKGGIYRIIWRDTVLQRTRQVSLGRQTPGDANRLLADFIDLYDAGEVQGEKGLSLDQEEASAEVVTVADVVAHYCASKGSDAAFAPIIEHLGGIPITVIDVVASESYTKARRPRSNGTIRRELAMLNAAANWCLRRRIIRPDQAPTIELPKASRPVERWLSDEEIAMLLEAASKEYDPVQRDWREARRMTRVHRFIAAALPSGQRRRVVERLRWDRVDMARRVIDFRDPDCPETTKRASVVKIPLKFWPPIERAFSERINGWFLDSAGSIRKAFDGATARAGLEGVTRHTLRHTRGTQLLRAGVGQMQVAAILGNKPETLMAHYAHALPAGLPEDLG